MGRRLVKEDSVVIKERSFKESEVKEICRNLARICTPSEFIVGIDDRFEEWWKVNFNAR